MTHNKIKFLLLVITLLTLSCDNSVARTTDPTSNQPVIQNTPASTLPMIESESGGSQPQVTPLPATPAAILPMVESNQAASPTPAWTPQAQAEAKAALEAYARDVLGLEVEILIGAGTTQEIELPVLVEEGVNTALALSGVTYLGVWSDGVASLSIGSGSLSGDTIANLQDGSLGIFSTRLRRPMPTDSAAALSLIQATYPTLEAWPLIANEEVTEGFAFFSSQAQDWSLSGSQVTLTGTVVHAGVLRGRLPGTIIVWVVVASGNLATPWQ